MNLPFNYLKKFNSLIMRKAASILMVFLCIICLAFQQVKDDFTGKWKTEKGQVINIYKTGAGFTGTAGPEDIMVLKEVHLSDGIWKGNLIKPGSNNLVPCELRLIGDAIVITAKKGMFSKSFTWTKVNK